MMFRTLTHSPKSHFILLEIRSLAKSWTKLERTIMYYATVLVQRDTQRHDKWPLFFACSVVFRSNIYVWTTYRKQTKPSEREKETLFVGLSAGYAITFLVLFLLVVLYWEYIRQFADIPIDIIKRTMVRFQRLGTSFFYYPTEFR